MAMAGAAKSLSFDDRDAWKIWFESLLEKRIGLAAIDSLQVDASDDEIILKTKNPNIEKIIMDILEHPSLLRENLGYHFTKNVAVAAAAAPPILERKEDISEEEVTPYMLKRIFTKRLLMDTGLLFIEPENDDSITHTIHFDITSAVADLWKERLRLLKSAMLKADVEGMHNAFLGKGKIIGHNEDKLFDEEQDQFDEIVEIKDKQFIFKYGALFDLMFPPPKPEINELEAEDGIFTLTFPRKELLSYLSRIPEKFMLAISDGKARPLVLPMREGILTHNMYTIIADCSGSMTEQNLAGIRDFPKYKENLRQFIDKIIDSASIGDIVRLVPFSILARFHELTVTDKINDKQILFGFINSLKPESYTRLYDTVCDELAYFEIEDRGQKKYQRYSKCMLVITDGYDNLEDDPADVARRKSALDLQLKALSSLPSHCVPKIFAVAIGGNCNIPELQSWSDGTKVAFVHLQTINDFKEINAHFEQMRRRRKLVIFNQGLQQAVSAYDDTLTAADFTLDLDKPFVTGGREYIASVGSVPAASVGSSRTFTTQFDNRLVLNQDDATKRKASHCVIN